MYPVGFNHDRDHPHQAKLDAGRHCPKSPNPCCCRPPQSLAMVVVECFSDRWCNNGSSNGRESLGIPWLRNGRRRKTLLAFLGPFSLILHPLSSVTLTFTFLWVLILVLVSKSPEYLGKYETSGGIMPRTLTSGTEFP